MTLFMLASVASVFYKVLAYLSALIVVPAMDEMQKTRVFGKRTSVIIVFCLVVFCMVGLLYLITHGFTAVNPDTINKNDNFVLMMWLFTTYGITLLIVMSFRFAVWLFREVKKNDITDAKVDRSKIRTDRQ